MHEITAAAAISVASFARALLRKSGVPDLRGRRATHRVRKIGAVSRIRSNYLFGHMILSESLQLFGIMLYAANGCLTWSRLAMTSDTFGSPLTAREIASLVAR